VNDCGPVLSELLRLELGRSEEVFFLKTHELPFERYFDGEYVLHIMREPGAVFWSYYNYLRKNEPSLYADLSLDNVIEGQVPIGSWSDHACKWLAAGKRLGERFSLYTYEDLSEKPDPVFCDHVRAFTGIPYRLTAQPLPALEHWHEQAPTLYRKDARSKWREHFSESQLRRIHRLHGKTMRRFNYDSRQYGVSLFEQLRRIVASRQASGLGREQ